MPGKRAHVEGLLEQALAALGEALDETGAPWMVIGGIALIARGVRRFTTDIDAAVRADAVRLPGLLDTFARHGIVPRIARAKAFAEANLVLLLRHRSTGVDLDVSLAWSSFEHESITASTMTRFGRVSVPMSKPEDLVVFKAVAGRPKDAEDIEALLLLYPKLNLVRIRHRLSELAALAESPELVAAFDVVVERVRSELPEPRRSRTTPRRRASAARPTRKKKTPRSKK